jgi:CubicO group peptidase (beta-lactamase class C family)
MGVRRKGVRLPLLLVAAGLVLLGCSGDGTSAEEAEPDVAAMRADLRKLAPDAAEFEEVRAIIVATSDEILLEQYYGTDRDTTWDVQSVTKSVVSTLVGIAVDEGLVSGLDAPLEQLLPHHTDAMSPTVARTTLRQLLTMQAGFPPGMEPAGPPFTGSEDWVRTILRTPAGPPGEEFVYSNGTAHLLAAVVEQASGMSVLDFARSRLFRPLRIDTRPALQSVATLDNYADFQDAEFAWPRDPQGVHTGWWGLKLRPRALMKLGRLVLADGIWNGSQLVSGSWLDDATSTQVDLDGLQEGYGFQWWTDEVDGDAVAQAIGYGGQLVVVVPDRDLVVVTTSEVSLEDMTEQGIQVDVLVSVVEQAILAHVPG